MIPTVTSKHKKTLNRRLEYLTSLGDMANSYDAAEVAALRRVLEVLEEINELEEALGENLLEVGASLLDYPHLEGVPQ